MAEGCNSADPAAVIVTMGTPVLALQKDYVMAENIYKSRMSCAQYAM